MKHYLLLLIAIPCILLSCTKDPITSAVGTYKLSFNGSCDGWKLVLESDGTGSLVHMADWEYDGSSVSNFINCPSFTYTVVGDNIYFNNCIIALDVNNGGKKLTHIITINDGTIQWGYTQGKKIHYSKISMTADVMADEGRPRGNWSNPSAYLCDSQGNVYGL